MKYTVITSTVGGLGKKIYKAGDKVTDANFPEGNAAKLEKAGFLKKVGKEDKPTELSKEEIQEAADKAYTDVLKQQENGEKISASERIVLISRMEPVEKIEEYLETETAKTVLEAGEARIKKLKAADGGE